MLVTPRDSHSNLSGASCATTVPCEPLVLLGLVACLLNGAMTPVFSFLLSRFIFVVSTGATDIPTINAFGGIVLSVAALDGVFFGVKYFVLETGAMSWVTHIRKVCYQRVLAQDKRCFDKSENCAVRLVQVLVTDGDEAGNLIAVVLGQCCVVGAMLDVGVLVKGWQLTLVAFAFAPVFAAAMAFRMGLVARCELRSKRAVGEVAKSYYEVRICFFFLVNEGAF
jgi:ATP-binding cassette, subfamily B (MDR/TAP), member 1